MVTQTSSLYEQFQTDFTTVMLPRVWIENQGDSVDYRWVKEDIAGTGSLSMEDTLFGGLRISCDAGGNKRTQVDFGGKRTFNHTASVCLSRFRRVNSASKSYCGLQNANTTNFATVNDDTANTYKALESADGSTSSETESGSATINTSFTNYWMEITSSNIVMKIDNVTHVTKTTNRPVSGALEPVCGVKGNSDHTILQYVEAYSTA